MKLRAAFTITIITSAFVFASLFKPAGPHFQNLTATYSNGVLSVSIPLESHRVGESEIRAEILDPEDKPLAGITQKLAFTGKRQLWHAELKLATSLATEDLIWQRLHYRATQPNGAPIDETVSLSQILLTPVVHVIGQSTYFANSRAAEKIVLTDKNGNPVGGAGRVRLEYVSQKGSRQFLYEGRLSAKGTAEPDFPLPSEPGTGSLQYTVESSIGQAEFTQNIAIEDRVSILLTTEKPIYQPSQTIHIRALALSRPGHEPVAERPLTFELVDSRGNKVFRKATQTDSYGVTSAEFTLADEVNLGAYHLRALLGDTRQELTVNVDRYVLPKFKVAVEVAAGKHGFRPGDHVKGTIRADYFFGKPVSNAEVSIKASALDVSVFEAGSVTGKTDDEGVFHYDFKLPSYFAGRPMSQGSARLLLEATVKDGAGHSETRGEPITVSQSPLLVTAVPESGNLIPGLQNQVFLLTSYPDGTPAQTKITTEQGTVQTDAQGVATIAIQPKEGQTQLNVKASDAEGNHIATTVSLDVRNGADQVLVRPDRAIYRVGERMLWKVFTTKQSGAVYLDLVREGQTVLTRDLDITNGQGTLDLTASEDLAGTLECNAYLFGKDAVPISDHRLVFVQPATDLHVETSLDAAEYKPGGEARVTFQVTNDKGQGVQAALGLQIVDQAVFALAEKQPGFAKVFFYLEQEALKPRYEIHSLDLPETITARNPAQAAKALFSATEIVRANRFTGEFNRNLEVKRFPEYEWRYRQALVKRASAAFQEGGVSRLKDAWGKLTQVTQQGRFYLVRSAGPDGEFDTPDDLAAYVAPSLVRVEHGRGPVRATAEISGTVTDVSQGNISGAQISIRETQSGQVRKTNSDSQGRFTFPSLPPGQYEITAFARGFDSAPSHCSVMARDRALVDLTLQVSGTTEMVEVTEERALVPNVEFDRRMVMKQATTIFANDKVLSAGVAAPPPPPAAPASQAPAEAPHVRSYFPEALYINPEVITDRHGRASISVPLADNITTWRMAMLASSAHGALGSGTASIKVFQDFFVDLDLPVTLTQGDQISLPIAIYNYADGAGKVELQLEAADWYTLAGGDSSTKSVTVEAGKVGAAQFSIAAQRIGKFKLTLKAQMASTSKRADIVVREIEVVPNGRELTTVFNGTLEGEVRHTVTFPGESIPDASSIFVRLYPGPLSQIVEGMDSLLRMPSGCFEQTSSSTYPNVLALDYMKRTKKLTPEVHAKAEGFISSGYQRLLTFEVPGGGFSWFGSAPANKILTAYGLMEFSDMAKVHDVDPRLIERTQQWLASQQQADGSWRPDTSFINEGATNRYNSDLIRITAYLGWALETTGYRGAAVEKAKQFVDSKLSGAGDAYTLAVVANFAVDHGKDHAFTQRAVQALLNARTEKDDKAWWSTQETAVYATGESAAVETTGLAVQALLKSGENAAVARKALNYITGAKNAQGGWGTTQATIMALRSLLLASEKGSATAKGTVEVLLNGERAASLTLNEDNNDLLQQFVLKGVDERGANNVTVRFSGAGSLAYQVAGRYFLPWEAKPAQEPLSITVKYDRTHLAQDDTATATATVRNNLPQRANMIMVDLGIPPGFELLTEDLDDYREKSAARKGGRLEKYSLTGTQAILYFDSIAARETFEIPFRLRAKYPIRAKTFASRVYEYYDPSVRSVAAPVEFVVSKR